MPNKKSFKGKYRKILQLAEPYYKKGRAAERLHHLVVAEMVDNIIKEVKNVDRDVLISAALLHDIGYAKIPEEKRRTHWAKRVKEDHMKYGAEIASKILKQTELPKEKISEVCDIILVHDNPEIGLPISSRESKLLKEADILWMTTEEAFWLDVGRRMIEPEEWLTVLKKRFIKEKNYTDYLTTKFSKNRIKNFFKKMHKRLDY